MPHGPNHKTRANQIKPIYCISPKDTNSNTKRQLIIPPTPYTIIPSPTPDNSAKKKKNKNKAKQNKTPTPDKAKNRVNINKEKLI